MKNMFVETVVAACCAVLAFTSVLAEPLRLEPKRASCTNLIVNGSFESGEFSPWTRNVTKGKANKQGRVSVCAAGGNSWVDGALGGKALVVQSFNNRDKVWFDSTDSYALQSFKVDDPGTYRLSFDYAGRGHREDKYWVRASCHVRILHGAGATGKALYEGVFSPVTKATYARYSEVVDIVEAGVYSLQFLLPQPVGTEPEACDKCVVIDNVCFARDGGSEATDLAFEPRGDEDRTAEVLAAVKSGACRDVTIRDNVFRNCVFLHGEGIIQIRPNLKDLKSQKERYHRNIVVEYNRFETLRVPFLRACSVSNLVWRSNEVIYNDAFPARGKEPFVIDYSEDVVIK